MSVSVRVSFVGEGESVAVGGWGEGLEVEGREGGREGETEGGREGEMEGGREGG